MRLFPASVALAFLTVSCAETTPPDICNPTAGRMIRGTHYVEADLLTEEGLWNYARWVEYYRKYVKSGRSGGCIPQKDNLTLSEQIDQIEKTVDLQR